MTGKIPPSGGKPPPPSPSSVEKSKKLPQVQSSSMSSSGAVAVAGGLSPTQQDQMVSAVKATAGVVKRKAPPPSVNNDAVATAGAGGGAKRAAPEAAPEATAGGGSGTVVSLSARISQCFGSAPEDMSNLEVVAKFCFEGFNARIATPEHLTTKEITNLHQLFFETALNPVCTQILESPLDVTKPHPAHIVKSLGSCIHRLSGEKCKVSRESSIGRHPLIKKVLEGTRHQSQHNEQFLNAVEKNNKGFKDAWKGSTVYNASDLFNKHGGNDVYILYSDEYKPSWVFKPVSRHSVTPAEKTHMGATTKYSGAAFGEEAANAEHAAYCLSQGGSFPIPCTFLVEINGDLGSIQMFVSGQDEPALPSLMEEAQFSKDVKAMLIFDLLFTNHDRKEDNFLVRKNESGDHRLYAIDHGLCLPSERTALRLDYKQFISDTFNFKEEDKALFSSESIGLYKQILTRLNLMKPSLDAWLDNVSVKLMDFDGTGSFRDVLKTIEREYENIDHSGEGGDVGW
ncbi:hypothetical protein COB21_04370 [Candidatus Aerophobetes bacterium]|uniref:PI3K/PI4K catalytic domain-containing protein n=1 Tax=Aerophobetes bacterium TaxID=2030807 RepID=A0A2A4X2D4_UNCAE|nr:MAG: hypothetical protein COB21_04370 [Candidatus Aerophobetes bacterium]